MDRVDTTPLRQAGTGYLVRYPCEQTDYSVFNKLLLTRLYAISECLLTIAFYRLSGGGVLKLVRIKPLKKKTTFLV